MRLIEPTSKLRTIRLLKQYFDIVYPERSVYRKMLSLEKKKESIEKIAIECAKEMLQEDLALVLYDVTTLYFETFKGDEFRVDMEKQLHRARELVEKNQPGKRAKFIKRKSKESQYLLNEALIEKTKLLLGMKGYYTNIPEDILSSKDVMARYHDLWQVEQAFRMAKGDLASRPIFHHKEDAIKSHILICFTALIIGKYLEIKTNLSLKNIIDAIWEITDAKLIDKTTNNTHILLTNVNQNSEEVLKKNNMFLSY